MPLFARSPRIPGAAKVLRSAEEARKKEEVDSPKRAQGTPDRKQLTLTLFVEGKLDELFVDYLRSSRDLAGKIDVADIKAVALGGLYQSPRLIELVRSTSQHAIFVLDDDEFSKRAVANDSFKDVQVVYVHPSFTGLLDVPRLYSARDQFPGFPEQTVFASREEFYREIERALFKRGSVSANADRILQIIDEFLDQDKYEEFATELRAKVDAIFSRDHSAPAQTAQPNESSTTTTQAPT